MKSFLIGSLPHEDVEEALNYSFSFDVPTLPTLPKINPNEFMMDQALRENEALGFVAKDAFFSRLSGRDYKWQSCGPLTLVSSLNDPAKAEEALEKLFDKIVETQKEFNSLSDEEEKKRNNLFFLDEPVLAFNEGSSVVLGNFLRRLKENPAFENFLFGLHACSKAGLGALKSLSFDLFALDPALYGADEWKEIQEELKEKLVYVPVSSQGIEISYKKKNERYCSSACGLALSGPAGTKKVQERLRLCSSK